MSRKIIIDCDPGQDDAVALLLALASPELDVLGVVAVAGNAPLERTALNALKVCELAGRTDVPVFAGMDRPLVRDLVTAEYVHGETGLDGADLPEPSMSLRPDPGVDWMIATLRSEPPGSVTVCPLGPLTNVAAAMDRAPDIVERIGEIVLMGGGFFEGGNTTPTSEFNIYVDPHAADIVFRSGVTITVLPLDVTHRALILPHRLERFRALGTRVGDVVAGWLAFYERYDVDKYGMEGGPLHDPCVIAYLLAPDLFGGRECNVRVETMSELTMGMTVVDWWGMTGRAPTATWVREIDAEGFFDLLVERIGRPASPDAPGCR